jgi:hypothetical protein
MRAGLDQPSFRINTQSNRFGNTMVQGICGRHKGGMPVPSDEVGCPRHNSPGQHNGIGEPPSLYTDGIKQGAPGRQSGAVMVPSRLTGSTRLGVTGKPYGIGIVSSAQSDKEESMRVNKHAERHGSILVFKCGSFAKPRVSAVRRKHIPLMVWNNTDRNKLSQTENADSQNSFV